MTGDASGTVNIVVSSAMVCGLVGYIITQAWKGYQEFRKYVYENMVKKEDCKSLRDACRELRDAQEDRNHG